MNARERLKRALGGLIFWSGIALTCVMLVPACLLLACVSVVLSSADVRAPRLKGTRA